MAPPSRYRLLLLYKAEYTLTNRPIFQDRLNNSRILRRGLGPVDN